MRVVLGSGMVCGLAGGSVRALEGDWPFAIVCFLLFIACAVLFVARMSRGGQP
jgi:membrane protein implicated in regulation of membrane protease activity